MGIIELLITVFTWLVLLTIVPILLFMGLGLLLGILAEHYRSEHNKPDQPQAKLEKYALMFISFFRHK